MSTRSNPHEVILKALESLEIQLEYPQSCIDEAAYWIENDGLDDPQLVDLTHLPFVTIDNEDSRDLDQALYIKRNENGYKIQYALADASYYIRPGSALFAQALKRGTTYYTPGLAAAMLPVELSEGLVSLNANETRRALVFDMSLDETALVRSCNILRARIQSQSKLSYTGVQQWLDSDAQDSKPYHPSLRLLREVGKKLIAASEARGVISFNRTETQINIMGSPPRFQASLRERVDTERYNEQISLICNMQGAQLMMGFTGVTDVIQAIFRVHEAPLRKNLSRLRETLDALAQAQDSPELWQWQHGQTLAEYVAQLPAESQYSRRVQAIQRQIMLAQRGSNFTPEPSEHHALKASSYARFSSPMREVVGIFTHKELLEALHGGRFDNDADHKLREQTIEAANTARQRQRQLDKKIQLATLNDMFVDELNASEVPWHEGTIVGMRSDKLYIVIDSLSIDVKIYRTDLDMTYATTYTIGDVIALPSNTCAPDWQLGQGVKLQVERYDAALSRFVFALESL